MEVIEESCDELATSLAYIDTSVAPHMLLGHVQVKKLEEKKNSVEFDYGKFL